MPSLDVSASVRVILARAAAESPRQRRHYVKLLEAIAGVASAYTLLFLFQDLLIRRAEYKRRVLAVRSLDPQQLTVAQNHLRHVEKQRLHQLHQELRAQQQSVERQHLPLQLRLAIDAAAAQLQWLLANHDGSPHRNRLPDDQLEARIQSLLDEQLVHQQRLDWLEQWNAQQQSYQSIRGHQVSEPEELGQLVQTHPQRPTVVIEATLSQSHHGQPHHHRMIWLMARDRRLNAELRLCMRKIDQTELLFVPRPHRADLQARLNCLCIQYRQLEENANRNGEMIDEESRRLRALEDQRLLSEAIESSAAGVAMALPVELNGGRRPSAGGHGTVPAVFAVERGGIVHYWHGTYVHGVNGAH